MRKYMIVAWLTAAILSGCGGDSITSCSATGTSACSSSSSSSSGASSSSSSGGTVTAASLTAISSVSSIPADGSATATITVLARNSDNNLISGVAVSFDADSGGIAVTNATTDSTGSATATLSTAGDPTLRTITVTATSAGGLTATVKVQVTGTNTGSTTAVASLTMSTSAATIPSDGSATATVTALARDASNNVLAGVPVAFSATSGAIEALAQATDATGTVTATVSTAGDTSLRTITVTGKSANLTSTVSVKVITPPTPTVPVYSMGNGTGTAFVPGVLDLTVNDSTPAGTLAAGGTTSLNLTIVDQTGALYVANPVTVTFSSPCLAAGTAQILASGSSVATTSITTSTGVIGATYVAKGCSGADTIKATAVVSSQSVSASGTVNIAASSVGSIQFVSATPTTIGLKGTGLGETSTVIFRVTDSTGGPKSGVPVSFALNTTVGGLSLSPATQTTASDGTVQTVVSSGTVHTVVRVTAAITNPALSTQSSQLTVTTGLPASASFSSAVGAATYANGASPLACPNVEGANIDGVTVPITVRLADRYNNPVPDGTSVAFTTDGGHVGGSCTTPGGTPGDGACTVTWTSANPRPTSTTATDTPAPATANRAIILATTIGEESFTDVNGTGFWQTGDPFVNLGEPYRDDNENGQYDSGEYFLDFNQNQRRDVGTGNFVGITCTGITATSTCTTTTLAISQPALIVMSTSSADISLYSASSTFTNTGADAYSPILSIGHSTAAVAASGNNPGSPEVDVSGSIVLRVQDFSCVITTSPPYHCTTLGNAMAAGTTITAVLDNTGMGTFAATPVTVGCASDIGGTGFTISFTSGFAAGASGTITVTVQSPSGSKTYFTIPLHVT